MSYERHVIETAIEPSVKTGYRQSRSAWRLRPTDAPRHLPATDLVGRSDLRWDPPQARVRKINHRPPITAAVNARYGTTTAMPNASPQPSPLLVETHELRSDCETSRDDDPAAEQYQSDDKFQRLTDELAHGPSVSVTVGRNRHRPTPAYGHLT